MLKIWQMRHAWQVALIVVVLLAAYLVPRYVLKPERHHWEIWIPAAVAVAAIVGGLVTRTWILAALAGVLLPIEIWRTLPVWQRLRSRAGGLRPRS